MKTSLYTLSLFAAAASAVLTERFAGVDYSIKGYKIETGEEFDVHTTPLSFSPRDVRFASGRSAGSRTRSKRGSKPGAVSTTNWCGAVYQSPPGGTFTNAFGTWDVVETNLRAGQSYADNVALCQWVGIDGASSKCNGLLQAGQFTQVCPPPWHRYQTS